MTPRLGFAAVLAALVAPMLVPGEAAAQRQKALTRPDQSSTPTPPPPQEKTFPLGASWSLVQFNGKPVYDRRVTLSIDQNLRGTGFGGCNTFSAAAYPLRQQSFAVGPIAITKRSCDKGTLDFERSFLTTLRATQKWDLVNGRLVLKGGAGELVLSRSL